MQHNIAFPDYFKNNLYLHKNKVDVYIEVRN